MDLGSIVEYWARWRPDAIAIRCGDQVTTWAELDRRTASVAAGLRTHGLGSGERVGIFADNCLEWCEVVLATFRAGGVVVPLNNRLTAREIAYMVSDAGCFAVAYDAGAAGTFAQVAASYPDVLTIGFRDAPAAVDYASLAAATVAGRVCVDADAPAVIAYTSGTTGQPKGAVLTHGNIMASQNQWRQAEGWNSETSVLLCVSLSFTAGIVSNFMGAYGCGGTLVLEASFDPPRALELLATVPINAMAAVPVMWQGIAGAPGFAEADLSRLSTAITGGAPAPLSLLKLYQDKGVQIRQAYALTESSASACVLPARFAAERAHSAGVPQVHTRIRIVDEDGADLPAGEVGEILVSGPQVMARYWNCAEDTERALAGGWLHTGDLGSLDENGFLSVVDRKNDLIISGGLNVYPAEIENVIADFPGVTEVGVFGVAHERWGETVAASVRGHDVQIDELIEYCRRNLGDYKVPRYVVPAVEPLPRSRTGKVLRHALRRLQRINSRAYLREVRRP